MLSNINHKWISFSFVISAVVLLSLALIIDVASYTQHIQIISVLALLGGLVSFYRFQDEESQAYNNISDMCLRIQDQERIHHAYDKAIQRSQAIIEFTPEGIILTANNNFCAAVGYDLSEIQGQHHRMFVDKNYSESTEYKDFWRKLAAGEFFQAEYQRFGKGGKEIWIQASYNPIFDDEGRVLKVVKYATDITAQKKQNIYFASQIKALDNSQAIIEFTPDGIILNANENFCAAVGYELSEIQGQHHRMFVDKNYGLTSEYISFWETLASGQFHQAEYQRFGKGGKEIWIQASYNPIFDSAGNVISVVKYASDITQSVNERRENNQIIQNAVTALENVSKNILNGADELAKRNDTQAVSIEETSASIEEIAESITETSHSAEDVSTMAFEVLTQAENNKEIMTKAVNAMEMLEKNAEKIDNIVNVIDTIASQTNLLALNAAVEAARAGDAGKGFGVVAAEVRSLASRCLEAASDLKKVISTSNAQISDSVDLVRQSGTSLVGMVKSINDVTQTITNISKTSQEQSINIKEISNAVVQIDDLTQKNAYLSDDSKATASQLAQELKSLLHLMEKMGGGESTVETFKKDMSLSCRKAS